MDYKPDQTVWLTKCVMGRLEDVTTELIEAQIDGWAIAGRIYLQEMKFGDRPYYVIPMAKEFDIRDPYVKKHL